jgi:hypothetical protein
VKALTLWPEWIPAILHYGKRVENRPWHPGYALSNLALHSGMRVAGGGNARDAFNEVAHVATLATLDVVRPSDIENRVVTGAIVALVDVVGYRQDADDLDEGQRPWFFGPWGWVLENLRPLVEPVPCRGHQGLWPVPRDIEAEAMRRLP